MKKITYLLLLASFVSFAQEKRVGINTQEPQRTLDANANLRIRQTELIPENERTHRGVLMRDKNNGNVDEIPLSAFQSYSSNTESLNKVIELDAAEADLLRESEGSIGCLAIRARRQDAGSVVLQIKSLCGKIQYSRKSRYWATPGAPSGYFNFVYKSAEDNTWNDLDIINYNTNVIVSSQLGYFSFTDKTKTGIYHITLATSKAYKRMMLFVEKL